jgi:hypothetical protein
MESQNMHKIKLGLLLSLFLLPSLASAQGPDAPTDLKEERLSDSKVRLSWTAPPGTGLRFLIERGGPGYTFFTQAWDP